jgi:hypothetical protein
VLDTRRRVTATANAKATSNANAEPLLRRSSA